MINLSSKEELALVLELVVQTTSAIASCWLGVALSGGGLSVASGGGSGLSPGAWHTLGVPVTENISIKIHGTISSTRLTC